MILDKLNRSKPWRRFWQGLMGIVIALLILDAVGLLLTMNLALVNWEPVVTLGSQSDPTHFMQTLTVGATGENLFVGTRSGGVFCFADDDLIWRPKNEGLTSLFVRALMAEPDEGGLLAGTFDGIFRSDDSGESWQPLSPESSKLHVLALLAGQESGSLVASTTQGVFRSADMGESWQPVYDELTGMLVSAIAMTLDGKHLYAGTYGQGVFHSEDSGVSWRDVNEDLSNLLVEALLVEPNESSLYAGTWGGGIFRSDDHGESWQPVNDGLTDHCVYALAMGRDGQSILAGTSGGGIFRTENGGKFWQFARPGLIDLSIRELTLGLDGKSILAETANGIFRSDDQGQSWHAAPNASSYDFQSITPADTQVVTETKVIRVTRPGMGWLDVATYDGKDPQLISIHRDHITLYALDGSAQIVRAKVPLPFIWKAPTPFLAIVTATRQTLSWIRSRAVPPLADAGRRFSSLGLVAAIASLYIFGMARFTGLHLSTVLSLLPHPRLLLSLSDYGRYAERQASSTTLERLILLQIPPRAFISSTDLEVALRRLGAVFGATELRDALNTLMQRGLLVRENETWRPTRPLMAQIQWQALSPDEMIRLAEQTHTEHPLFEETCRFFRQAGIELVFVPEVQVYRCKSSTTLGSRIASTMYAQIAPGKQLDAGQIRNLYTRVKSVDKEATVAFAITDRRPSDEAWAQIGTLRLENFTVLPIENTLLREGLATGRERELLRQEIEQRLGGDYDPYDVRDPVAGVFSFFGRDVWVDTLSRRLAEGRPVGIFGLRKIGKTSLLHCLRDNASLPVATINMQTVGRAPLNALYTRILRYWERWVNLQYGRKWESPHIASDDSTGTFVTATLDLLDLIEREWGEARLALFLDEVDLLVPHSGASGPELMRYLTLLRALRGLIDEDGRLSLVVSSLNPSINRINAWGVEQNPAFNLFQEVYLPPLQKKDCILMVRNIGQQIGLVYSDESVQAVSDLSGGHPFLARQLCSILYQRRERSAGQIEASEVSAAVQKFIYDDRTVVHLDAGIWQDAGNTALWGTANAKVNQALLLDLARSADPVSQDDLLSSPDADLRQAALINLERFHFIYQPQPGFYALRFGLLRIWLRRRKLGLE